MAKEKTIGGYSLEEFERIQNEFNRDCRINESCIKSFTQYICDIVQNDTASMFAEKTMLNENMLHRLKNKVDKSDPPRMSTLISVCVGYDVNLGLVEEMLHSLGCSFNNRKMRDNAYRLLLTTCRGKDIEECNEILAALGVNGKRSLLGTN